MNAATASRPQANPVASPARLDDLIPLFGGGIVLAGVAILVSALVDAMAIAMYEYFAGQDPATWPTAVVIAFGVFAVAVSAVVGRWLFGLRRWIGQKGDPADLEIIRRKRRSFTIGAICLYLPVTPFVWVMVVAIAYSAT